MAPGWTALPIDPLLPALAASLRVTPNLVLTAEPGAGKTTRVPRALLDAGLLEAGECWVLEPRRLAARLAAARVAQELGEDLGQRAGYAVRFEQKVSRATRIRFVTEGLLLRRLQGDPRLRGIAAVILDEFHERHLQTDLGLALLRRLQRTARPDLRLLVMSATLDPGPVAAFLEAPTFKGEGRPFPVEVRHAPRPDDRPLALQVAEAVTALQASGLRGHLLVFLPGAADIRACARELEPAAQRFGLLVLPLHGELSPEAQAEALAPSAQPKVLLSTNVAESSVTLDGIAAVVDSGLGREAFHSPWSGLPGLRTARISQARCIQRAGRAGRTGPGLCVRLFTEADFRARPAQDAPELFRADLAEPLLALHALGLRNPGDLDWFEPPPLPAMEAGERLLRKLGALAPDGGLTQVGERMAALPLHPRLARLVVAGEDSGIPGLARLGAVLLESGDLLARRTLDRDAAAPGGPVDSDLLVRLDAYQEAAAHRFGPGALRASGLDPGAVALARRTFASLAQEKASTPEEGPEAELRLRQALLRAYPDRVSRARGATLSLVGGGGAVLGAESRVRRAEFLLALEAGGGGTGRTRVTLASAVEPEWLLEAYPDAISDREQLAFDPGKGRVEWRSGLWYEDLCLDERRRAAKAGEPGVAACLEASAAALAPAPFDARLTPLVARCAFLSERRPDLGLAPSEKLRADLLGAACEGCASLADLEATDWLAQLRRRHPEAAGLLPAWAPEEIQLPRRRMKVHYGEGPPWVASRLQDFFGLKEGPRIAGGSVPLVLHLLAPNQRAVQVTTDLAGFWQRAYRELRPQLSRRYPKHHWPEDPGRRTGS